METCLGAQLKDILVVQYVGRKHILVDWNMEKRTHIQDINDFFYATIHLGNKRKHSMVNKSLGHLHKY